MKRVDKIDPGTTVHQLREAVPMALQGAFFFAVRTRRKAIAEEGAKLASEQEIIQRVETLRQDLGEELSAEQLLEPLTDLACCDSVEALRYVEGLIEQSEGNVRSLLLLVELEIRMQVHEQLTDEPQAIIASGLGGEGELIRLNGVAMQRQFEPWQAYQKELLHRELELICQESGGYLEEELWGEVYYGFRIMLPYYLDIAEIIEQYLNTCNEYGQFLHPDCHVTNMVLLNHEDLQELVQLRKGQSMSGIDESEVDNMINLLLGGSDTAPNSDEDKSTEP